MSEKKSEDLDFKSMSEEDLGQWIDQQNGQQTNTPEKSEVNQDEPEQTEDSNEQKEVVKEDQEETEEVESKPVDKDKKPKELPAYKDKSRDDVIEMHRNAEKKITFQGQQLHEMTRRLADLEQVVTKNQEPKKEDPVNKLLEEFEEKDVTAVQALIQRELKKQKEVTFKQTEQQKREAIENNEMVWENLESFSPDIAKNMYNDITGEMKKDPDSTYHKKGWAKEYITNWITNQKKSNSSPESNGKLIKRKISASTIESDGSVSSSKKVNKPVAEMSPDEYLKHLELKGIKI